MGGTNSIEKMDWGRGREEEQGKEIYFLKLVKGLPWWYSG